MKGPAVKGPPSTLPTLPARVAPALARPCRGHHHPQATGRQDRHAYRAGCAHSSTSLGEPCQLLLMATDVAWDPPSGPQGLGL